MDLSKVSIGIRTFLRDECLKNSIAAIRRTMPDAKMIIADCGEHTQEKYDLYSELSREGHLCFTLPWDSGFGCMSNCIASAATRPYLLIGSDDFDFNPPEVRKGIESFVECLDNWPTLSVVSGRVNNKFYEYYLEDKGDEIKESPALWGIYAAANQIIPWLYPIDLTVNYCLVRKEVFQKVQWDPEAKIGQGEHGSWFVDIKRAGLKVGWIPGVSISEQPNQNSDRYREFRNRARSPERSCFKKRGIKKYVLGCGTVDYEET
jgi:hypothetical protein